MGRWDDLAWHTIRTRTRAKFPPKGVAKGGPPRNFQEVELLVREGESFEDAFEGWLREFYRYQDESFLAVPPSDFSPKKQRAWMAGVAEGLSRKLGLAVPNWVNDPEFVADEIWDWEREALDIFFPGGWAERTVERLGSSDPEFRRRRVIAKLRSLTRV